MTALTESEDSQQIASRQSRAMEKLKRDLGTDFLVAFNDPLLVEIMINPDGGKVYTERVGESMIENAVLTKFFQPQRVEAVIKTIAGFHGKVVTDNDPILEAQFPLDGSRFTGMLPPIVATPTFTLRKKPSKIFTLQEYVDSEIMTENQKSVICEQISKHANIIVCGGTGSGKTTLVNGVIDEISNQYPHERIYISEDTGEIQCKSENRVQVYTTYRIDHTRLVKTALRYRPDRIILGEVRGPEALDLLDAWNTGHPGGICTLHANSATAALQRLESLITRHPQHPKDVRRLIAEVVNIIVFITRSNNPNGPARVIEGIIQVTGYNYQTDTVEYTQID